MTPTPLDDYLACADVWEVLDLIAQEFKSDPTSVQCFDLRLVARTIELAARGRPLAVHIQNEVNEAHQTLDALGSPKVTKDNITLNLRSRILLVKRPNQ